MSEKLYRDKEWLQEQYDIYGSITKVAKKFGYTKSVVIKWAHINGIKLKLNRKVPYKRHRDPKWLIDQYRKGKTTAQIAQEAGVNRSNIDDVLRIHKIDVDKERSISIPYRSKEWLEKEFLECGNGVEIAKKHGYDKHTIYKYLREFGISKRVLYSVDEDFFEDIDTEEKAYWLGFIVADGYLKEDITSLDKPYYTLRIKLQDSDRDHLLKFLKSVNSDAPVIRKVNTNKNRKTTYSAQVSITNQKLANDLIRHGVVPNKTGREYVPDTVPEKLLNHFLRGFLDGDGSIRHQKRGTKTLRAVTFTSSLRICNDIKNILENIVSERDSLRLYEATNCWTLGIYRKEEIPRVLNYLYKESSVYMERKYSIAKNYITIEQSPPTE